MKTVRKKKNISKEYESISVNEKDLSYIAKLTQEVASKDDAEISIEIVSGDKEDVIISNNHTVFYSNDIPKNIDSVKIALVDYRSPTTCRIELDPNFFRPAQVTIYGEDIDTVNALFREIDRELSRLKFQDILKFKYLNSIWYSLFWGAILAISAYSLFDLVLINLDAFVIGFDGSNWDKVITIIGWLLVSFSFMMGGTYLTSKLQKIFPKIRFTGKFEDEYHQRRKNLSWIIGAIILPIILNLLSSFLWNIT